MTPPPAPMGGSTKPDSIAPPSGIDLPKPPDKSPTLPSDKPPSLPDKSPSLPPDLASPPPTIPSIKPNPMDVPPLKPTLPDTSLPNTPPPPIGGAPTNPPIGVRPTNPPARPDMQEADPSTYDEEWYYCKQGDTLETICQKYYSVTKYAAALRQYNLDRNQSVAFRSASPSFAQGQVVKVPPARVLERKYPAAVPGYHGPGASDSSNSIPPTNVASMSRDDNSTPGEYTVSRPNMTLRDIARDELHNPDEWQRIFLLNRTINPSAPIPEGTKIYLPRPLPHTGQ
jgi:nucleoid-associated protein YgaU